MTDIQGQITILVALQGVELEILKTERQIFALNDEASSLGQASAEHEAQVAAEKKALDELKKTYRELESESKDNAAKIEKSNEKLRAVKTNKEYQSTLKEIEEIQKKNSGIEDRMIELLDQLESQEGALSSRKKPNWLSLFRHVTKKRLSLQVVLISKRRPSGSLRKKRRRFGSQCGSENHNDFG